MKNEGDDDNDCWEYWVEFWKPEETCYHSDASEISPANAGVKNSQGVI